MTTHSNVTLSAHEAALARHHTYTLLSRLYLEGVTADLLPYLQAIPELTAVLPQPFDADQAGAEHHALFRFNLFPHQAIFLDAEGLLGGAVAEQVSDAYRQHGFPVDASDSSPDHIGYELALLAFLCGAEAGAWDDEQPAAAARMRQRQQQFLTEHLLHWLFPFAIALQQQENAIYAVVAEITVELVISHFDELDGKGIRGLQPTRGVTLPDPPPLLEEPKTGLRDIAVYLLAPAYSGFYLGRDDVGRLARSRRLPRGFGGRDLMLHNLLQAAAQYGELPALVTAFTELLQHWQTAYGRFVASTPVLEPFLQPWQERLETSLQLLAELAEKSDEAGA